jgi:hypothetical protein
MLYALCHFLREKFSRVKKSLKYQKVGRSICGAAALFALLTTFVVTPGCGSGGNRDAVDEILIRAGESTVTVQEFQEAFKSGIAAASVPYGDTEALRSERYRTLNRLTEELIILQRARELKIEISDEELALAVNDIKKDYPDDTFEETLIENGISYLTWEKGLKRRLLMEKVVRRDVQEDFFPVPLPFDEADAAQMNAEFQVHFPLEDEDTAGTETGDAEALPEKAPPENGEETVGETRNRETRENETEETPSPEMPESGAESEYDHWLNRLKNQYTIEINWELWEKIEQGDTGAAFSLTE